MFPVRLSLSAVVCFVFGLVCFHTQGQNFTERAPEAVFETVYLGKDFTETELKDYLKTRFLNGQTTEQGLDLRSTRKSLTGNHYLYRQTVLGKPVYGSQIKVNTDFEGNIVSIFHHRLFYEVTTAPEFPDAALAHALLNDKEATIEFVETEAVWWPVEERLVPALKATWGSETGDYEELILGASGEVLMERDRLVYACSPHVVVDTPATGMVFSPDPLTTASVGYGAPYTDRGDSNYTLINNERIAVTLDVTYNGSEYVLENDFIQVRDFSSPNILPATSPTPNFSFTRGEDGFEDVMVLYHITEYQLYLRSLGFNNLVDYQIHVDAHGFNGADQSSFNASANPPRLTFGEGGVDDAEDADVIIHEYGHAISNSAAPGTNLGTQRNALDEALGDYLAASYSRALSSFNFNDVFNWDGHNEFWNGRVAVSSKTYPNDIVNNIYTDADIWSATIMQIQDDIGREKADRILLESLFGYTAQMTMAQAALLYVQADELLYNGAHRIQICDRFNQRGLLEFCTVGVSENERSSAVELQNSYGYTFNGEDAFLHFGQPVSGLLEIADLQGRVMQSMEWHQQQRLRLENGTLPNGIYLVTARWNGYQRTFKLVSNR